MRVTKKKKRFSILRFFAKLFFGTVKLIFALGWGFIKLVMLAELTAKAFEWMIRILLFPFQFIHIIRQLKDSLTTDEAQTTWTDLSAQTFRMMMKKPGEEGSD